LSAALRRWTLPAGAALAAVPMSAALGAAPSRGQSGVPLGIVAIGLVVFAALLFGLWAYFYYKERDLVTANPPSPAPPPPPPPRLPEPSIQLTGFDTDGRSIRWEISQKDATRGVIVGRAPRNKGGGGNARKRIDISSDGRVSRDHIQIDHDGGGFTVTDLKSLNGTFLNDEAIPPHLPRRLKQNDKLTLGKHEKVNVLVLHVALNGTDGVKR
jgi:hypothetical protein